MVKIEKIIPGGQALGTLQDGKKVFFWNALPGEIVTEYLITKNKSHYLEATAQNIKDPSKFRLEPKDPCFLSTSPWQIMDYDYELKLKSELVAEIFREHQIIINPPKILTDRKEFFYRNKMEYSLYWNKQTEKISLAFHQRGSHYKIPIHQSSIEHPEIFSVAQNIINDLNNHHEEARKYQSLLLRCNQKGEVSGGLYENHKPHTKFNNLTDTILGREYSYSPNGFFQINIPVYELALKEIKNYIVTEEVLDLYSGVGTIGLSVASDRHLTLIESDRSAFNEMVKNITIEGVLEDSKARDGMIPPVTTDKIDSVRNGNTFAILAKTENTLNYIAPNQTVILDPPRAGCDYKLVEQLINIVPEKIIYLSCNPATQARDIKILLKKYQIEDTKTFNFFPRTPHIENLVILSKNEHN